MATQGAALLSQLTDCTPYLLQLGLTKSRTSLVWIAGPLSGLIMQPVVGVLADNSRSKWGRRRPFMIGGALIVAVCLLVLGWTGEIVQLFVREPKTVGDWTYSPLGVLAYDGLQAKSCTIALAVLSIYAVDFAINAGWCSAREQIDRTADVGIQSSLRAEVSSSTLCQLQSSSLVLPGVRDPSLHCRVHQY